MSVAAARVLKARIVRASGTVRPRMWSSTSRAFRADVRTHFACARTPHRSSVATSLIVRLFTWAWRSPGVAAERPGRCELAELVPDHLLGHEDGHVLAAVVDRDRVPDHLGEDRGRARPGADHPLLAGGVHGLDPAQQPVLDEGPFLDELTHA